MLVTVFRGFLGILALIFIAYLFSRNRRAVDWTQIAVALLLQLVLGVAILYVPFVGNFIEVLGRCFVKILDFTHAGSKFLFGDLVDVNKVGYIFVFQVLHVTVFFAALTSILYF
ncbi:Na+ dependent nucleoside transporter N-terminal domain-containing protein, partial [Alistipes indistinctus]|uniref:Na+ dependent nucleoside transporter N-terminal domain-containing protein n=1 Tax=Alistipes indistinctus TaxID=626932 RepID=UPI00249586DB